MSYCTLLLRSFAKSKKLIKKFTAIEAISELRLGLQKPEIESYELILKMGVDPTIGEHMVKGHAFLPLGTGKSKKIAVFIPEEHKKYALDLGASIAGDDLLKEIKENKFNFEQVLATAEMADVLKPLSRTLGVRGLMPTTRNNTLITFENLEKEMQKLKKGMVTYRMTKSAILQAAFGKAYLTDTELLTNLKALLLNINEEKPKKLKKKFISTAFMSTTYGKSFRLDLNHIDLNHFKSDFINIP